MLIRVLTGQNLHITCISRSYTSHRIPLPLTGNPRKLEEKIEWIETPYDPSLSAEVPLQGFPHRKALSRPFKSIEGMRSGKRNRQTVGSKQVTEMLAI